MPSIPTETARAWAEIDLAALVQNARTIARISGARLLPMLKAGAYGLGALPCARALCAVDPWGFGVVTPEEGAALRAGGITLPIVVFSPLQSRQTALYQTHALRPVIGDLAALQAWGATSEAPFHVEVDTGMSRSGFRWDAGDDWPAALHGAAGFEGVCTHFHSADSDPASVQLQWRRFEQSVARLPRRPPLVHAANSAAALRGTAYAADLVRPGIFLYGGDAAGLAAAPVVRLHARVVALRTVRASDSVSYGARWTARSDTRVATLGIGYADGVHRALGNEGVVELNGQVVPIIGRVTMDFTMVAVDATVGLGDVATLYGGLVSLDTQATRGGTIAYELLTSIGPRVARTYLNGG